MGVVTGSAKSWIIGSNDYDGNLSEGTELQFRFRINYSGSKPAIVKIVFNQNSLCKAGSGTTQRPSTTTTSGVTTTKVHRCYTTSF